MDSESLVSIVIPCYQQGNLLMRALISIEKQTYKNIEVIVVDDGSEPAITVNVDDFDLSISVIRQVNKGLSNARNTGLAKANGQFIKFLDADDELLPHCLFDQVHSLPANDRFISVIGFIEHQEESKLEHSIIPAFTDGLSALLLVNIGPPHIYLYTTESVRCIGGFHEGERVDGGHEDYDLVFRMLVNGMTITTVHNAGVVYYKRAGTMSTIKDKMDRTRSKVWAYNVRNLCRLNDIKPEEVLLSLITGYCLLLEITMAKYLPLIIEIEFDIVNILRNASPISLDSELSFLYKRLCLTGRVPKLTSTIAELMNVSEVKPISINSQEVNNSRVSLLQRNGVNSTLEWIQEVFDAVSQNTGPIAVYGAGELGVKITALLCSINRVPTVVFDRNYEGMGTLNNIKVVSPDDVGRYELSLLIVASLSFRAEILSNLAIYPNLQKV